jgi:hypothetical protein
VVATKAGSANQLNPIFMATSTWLEAENKSGREAGIVLRCVKETAADEVSFEAPGEEAEDAVIEASANGCCKRGVRAESVGVDVGHSEHGLGKGADRSDRNRHARAEQEIIDVGVRGETGRADHSDGACRRDRHREFQIAVVRAEISDDSNKGKEFALERSFPAVQALAINANHVGVEIGIPDINISPGWNLRRRENSQRENDDSEDQKLAHNHLLFAFPSHRMRKVVGCVRKALGSDERSA